MNKFRLVEIYEMFSNIEADAEFDSELIYDACADIKLDGEIEDELLNRLESIIDRFENCEIASNEAAAAITKELSCDYEAAKRDTSSFDGFFAELNDHIDAFFISRGFKKRGKGEYELSDATAVKGVYVNFDPLLYDNEDLMLFPLIQCYRADVKDEMTIIERLEPNDHLKPVTKTMRVPVNEFDLFSNRSSIPYSTRSKGALRIKGITCPEVFKVVDGETDVGSNDPTTVSVGSAGELYDRFEPFLDAACSILDKKKPNAVYRENYRQKYKFLLPALSKPFLWTALISILAGLAFGALVLVFDLIFGDAPPIHWYVILNAALIFGGVFALVFAFIFAVIIGLTRYNSERF